jgi:hypothetical protein
MKIGYTALNWTIVIQMDPNLFQLKSYSHEKIDWNRGKIRFS